MKKLLTLALFFLLTLGVSAETLMGRFHDLEFGDYAHVLIKDGNGEIRSFWLGNDKSLMKFVDNPERYKGKKVKVHWHSIKRHIPQAGGEMEIEEATKIEVFE